MRDCVASGSGPIIVTIITSSCITIMTISTTINLLLLLLQLLLVQVSLSLSLSLSLLYTYMCVLWVRGEMPQSASLR